MKKVLLGRRSPQRLFYPGSWDLFGGHIEGTETPGEALVRELQEELGIRPMRWRYWGALEEPNPAQHGPGLYHIYVVSIWEGTPTNRDVKEHTEIAWFSFADAMHLNLAHPRYRDILMHLESHYGLG